MVINISTIKGDALNKYKFEENEIIISSFGTVGITKVFDIDDGESTLVVH